MKSQTTNQSFQEYLMNHISAADYRDLASHLGESQKYTTMILRNPKIGTTRHMAVFMKLLTKWDKGITAQFLMNNFGFGKINISKAEIEYIHN